MRTAGPGERQALVLDAALAEIEKLAAHPRVRVVGETGLDHHWVDADDVAGRAAQVESFRWHIDAGQAARQGAADPRPGCARRRAARPAPRRARRSAPSSTASPATSRWRRHCADQGWYLSFAGTLTFKNAEPLREALRAVPLDQVLVETDAPYLAPTPYRGQTNASYLVPLTVRCMAEVLGVDLETLCARLDATAEALYGPW